jgi:peptidoglycan-associated lipoprotein
MLQVKPGVIAISLVGFALLCGVGCSKKGTSTAKSTFGDVDSGGGVDWEEINLDSETLEPFGEDIYDIDLGAAPVGTDSKAQSSDLQTVYFDYDSSNLRPDQMVALDANAEYMRMNGTCSVEIQGHCDERGTPEYNLSLGERRALSVRNYLIGQGIDAGRLYTVSFGEEMPATVGSGEDAFSQNRRAEFWIVQM